jgi:LuxR family transcriptional regulator, maltose regulon positive regulatory protein
VFTIILASIGLANIQESENQLYQAAETYQRILQMAGDQPLQIIHEAHQGMARILYQWNDLNAAEQYGRQSLHLARQYDRVIDRFIICEVFMACLKLARGDVDGAAASLAETAQSARQPGFTHRIPEVAAAQVLVLLRQGKVVQAANLAQEHDLPFVQARVHLAQGDTSAALAVLDMLRQQAEERNWHDDRLRIMVLQAVTLQAQGNIDEAVQRIGEALSLAEPGGYIRLFVDEGPPMARLLSEVAARGMMPDTIGKLLAVFEAEQQRADTSTALAQALIDPLSERELEVLQLTAQGLSNQEIAARLFLALSTVKGHNQRIFDKLQVQRRTEAIARARELGLI